MDDGRWDNLPYGFDEDAFEAYWGYDGEEDEEPFEEEESDEEK